MVVIAVESSKILALINLVVSAKAVPEAVPNKLILLDKLTVSRANLNDNIFEVSAF